MNERRLQLESRSAFNPVAEGYRADSSLPDYDEGAARLLMQRVLSFLDNIA